MTTNLKPAAPALSNPFTVGGGATSICYSDRHAYTVIAVTPTTITLQRDKATLLNGCNSGEDDALVSHVGGFCAHVEGTQRYSYEADPNGHIIKARLKKKLRRVSLQAKDWTRDAEGNLITHKMVQHWANGSQTIIPGRHEHYDFNH